MKKIILALLLSSVSFYGFCKTWEITNIGMTFSPETVTISQGDIVNFNIDASHNAAEVSQTVWNANGNSPTIGFSIPFGGGTVSPSALTVGTHYYMCWPHASLGMKGKIIVQATTGLEESNVESNFSVYTNPVSNQVNVQLNFAESTHVKLELIDIQSRLVSVLESMIPVSGSYTRSFDLPNTLTPGIYLVRMTSGNTHSYRKMVVF